MYTTNITHRNSRQNAFPSCSLRILLGCLLASLWLRPAGAVLPDTPDPGSYVTNNRVNTIVIDGETTYLGGYFTQIGPLTGFGAPFDAITGAAGAYPKVNGSVKAVVPDGSGGWYIGGNFTKVGNLTRHYIARILADGSVDAKWNPDANSGITAMTLDNGKVYVGGWFTRIGGQSRNYIAALDASGTGAADAKWNPNPGNSPDSYTSINTLVSTGARVWVGGHFNRIGGIALNSLARIDSVRTGAADVSWDPNLNPSASVSALAISGTTLYVGGSFYSIGGQNRKNLAVIDTNTALANSDWNPDPDAKVNALALQDKVLYVGGGFSRIGGFYADCIAALNTSNGKLTGWYANANGPVLTLSLIKDRLYAGGSFSKIGGQWLPYVAALSTSTGLADANWKPNPTNSVNVLQYAGGKVYAGGEFNSFGGVTRNGLAAVTTATGITTDWNPNLDGIVYALAVNHGTLYVGGNFNLMDGQAYHHLVAFSTATGKLDFNWNPAPKDAVKTLAVKGDGSTVYVGGNFKGGNSIGGLGRNYLAALNPAGTRGSATAWDPYPNKPVTALAVNGDTVYAAGDFTDIGYQSSITRLVALSASTGLVDAQWNPSPNDGVYSLALSADGDTLYAGGGFTRIGGQSPRNHIAAISTSGTGLASDFNPNADDSNVSSSVSRLLVNGSTVYAAGVFTSIGGQPRKNIASLDETGAATAWNPGLTGRDVSAVAVSEDGNTVYLGVDAAEDGRSGLALFKATASNAKLGKGRFVDQGDLAGPGGSRAQLRASG